MDKALKQRLVGASVLVALAVIVLPMLLGGQPESTPEARQIDIPPQPRETTFETRRFPIGDQEADAPSVVPPADEAPVNLPAPSVVSRPAGAVADEPVLHDEADSGPAAAEENEVTGEALASSPALDDPELDNAVTQAPVSEPEPEQEPEQEALSPPPPPPTPPTQTPADGRYLVQVASFSATGNATRLAARLREQGLPVIEDTIDSEAGTLHRVRLGPFEQRGQADQAIASLRRQYSDLSPRVLDLRPGDEAPVTEPADPLVRWVVQLGSFGEPENAEQLVFRLRDEGYSAFSVAVSGSSGTAHKVRVGPVVSRDEAVRLESNIESSMGLDGLVMSTD